LGFKITKDSYILADVHLECPDGRLTELNIDITFASGQT